MFYSVLISVQTFRRSLLSARKLILIGRLQRELIADSFLIWLTFNTFRVLGKKFGICNQKFHHTFFLNFLNYWIFLINHNKF